MSQTYTKNYRQLRKPQSGKTIIPRKEHYQLVLQYQKVSLHNTPKIILHRLRHIDKGSHKSQEDLLEGLEERKLCNSTIIPNLSS